MLLHWAGLPDLSCAAQRCRSAALHRRCHAQPPCTVSTKDCPGEAGMPWPSHLAVLSLGLLGLLCQGIPLSGC